MCCVGLFVGFNIVRLSFLMIYMNLLHICICWMFFWMYNCMLVRMCHSCRKTHQRNQVSIEMICHVNVSASLASLTTKPFGVTSPKVTDCFIQCNSSHSEQRWLWYHSSSQVDFFTDRPYESKWKQAPSQGISYRHGYVGLVYLMQTICVHVHIICVSMYQKSHMLHLTFDSMYRCMFYHKCQRQMQFPVPCRKEWGVPTSGPSKELGWGATGLHWVLVSARTWECLMCFLKGMCLFLYLGRTKWWNDYIITMVLKVIDLGLFDFHLFIGLFLDNILNLNFPKQELWLAFKLESDVNICLRNCLDPSFYHIPLPRKSCTWNATKVMG